ncbi:MAG: TolC family protein [Muribaculum sp.]|nr:TolC family protein [Muribaculum sp.]
MKLKNNAIKFLVLTVVLTSGLCSCKLGQKYVSPDVNLPVELYDGALSEEFGTDDTITVADRLWWQVYSDTALVSLIEKTLEHNKDLLMARARIQELAAMKRISTSRFFPQINGDAYMQKEGLNYGGNNFSPDPEDGLKVSATWELDLWGNIRWARDKSIAEYLAAIESKRALQISLIAQVATAYFQLVALDTELDIVRRTLHARQEGVRLAKLRFEGGLTSEMAYQQARVEYAKTATLVPTLERNIAIKESDIAFLAGEYPRYIARNVSSIDTIMPSSLPVGLPSELLLRRPDVRSAEQSLRAANAAVGVAYTDRFPRLRLTAQGGFENDELSDFLKSPMYFLSGALTGPIFDAGNRQAAYRAKQAAYERETFNYEKTVLSAFKDAHDAIVDYSKTSDIYKSRLELLRAAKTATDLAQLQYINGVIGYLDVLDAQRSYFDAQISFSNANRDACIAFVNLYASLGGGWSIDDR